MSGTIDTIKGRLKEAVGVLTDNDDLKREGQRDQAVGEVKEEAARVAGEVKEEAARVAEQVQDEVARAVDKAKNKTFKT